MWCLIRLVWFLQQPPVLSVVFSFMISAKYLLSPFSCILDQTLLILFMQIKYIYCVFTFIPPPELLLLLITKLPLSTLRYTHTKRCKRNQQKLSFHICWILLPRHYFAIGSPHLVTEDLDLSEGPVDGPASAAVVAVGVDLNDQRHTLHPLLQGEVCAQTVHGNKDLGGKQKTDVRIRLRRSFRSWRKAADSTWGTTFREKDCGAAQTITFTAGLRGTLASPRGWLGL